VGKPRARGSRLTTPDEAAAAWSRLHHGLDPHGNRLLWCWLRAMWWLATPLTRLRVPPLVITALGAALAVVAASISGLAWLALILVVASVVCDGLDGAVAALGNTASSLGAVADKLADRIADVAFVVVIWRCGAPGWLAVLTAAGVLSVEAVREAVRGPVVITVGERPSRVVCTVLACASAQVSAAQASAAQASAEWPATVCACVLLGLSVIACGQLVAAGRAT